MSSNQDVSHISGNVSDEVKRFLGNTVDFFIGRRPGPLPIFGESIIKRMVVNEISVKEKAEEPQKLEGRFVCEITVEEGLSIYLANLSFDLTMDISKDMINRTGNVHGGCSALLVDM